ANFARIDQIAFRRRAEDRARFMPDAAGRSAVARHLLAWLGLPFAADRAAPPGLASQYLDRFGEADAGKVLHQGDHGAALVAVSGPLFCVDHLGFASYVIAFVAYLEFGAVLSPGRRLSF